MSKYRVTRESILAARPCWLDDEGSDGIGHIEAIVPDAGLPVNRASVEMARAAGVSNEDIHWTLAHAAGLPDRIKRLAACAAATRALGAERALEAGRAPGREPDPSLWGALEVMRRHVIGEATGDELADATRAVSDVSSSVGNGTWTAITAISWAVSARSALETSRAISATAIIAARLVANAAAAAVAGDGTWAARRAATARTAAARAAWAASVEDILKLIEEEEERAQ